jgi:hypothetical protein
MSKLKYGGASYDLPAKLNKAWPNKAGSLRAEEVKKIPKARRGLGLVCQQGADALRKVGSGVTVSADITPEALEEAGELAEAVDLVVHDLEQLLTQAKQANLLLDAAAYDMLRQLNDAVHAQGKFKPELLAAFSAVTSYFKTGK